MPLYNNSIAMRAALGISRAGNDRTGRAYSGFGAEPPCAPCDAARRAAADRAMGAPPVFYDDPSKFAGFRGFGELKENPSAPLTDFYGRTDDRWDIWMNEAARTWARVTGNVEEAIIYRNRGVQLNGAFGKGYFESCSTFATPLPDSTTDCNDIPCLGLLCRGLPANFHPCESVVRGGLAKAAEKCGRGAADFVQGLGAEPTPETASAAQQQATPAGFTVSPDRAALMAAATMGLRDSTTRLKLQAAASGRLSTLLARTGTTTEDQLSVEEQARRAAAGGSKMNTALIVGAGVAVVAAIFLLKK